jgi:hypothetical protein
MATTTITFHVPHKVAQGLASGRYQLFGGVVRNNAGRVVTMLDPLSRSASRLAKLNPKLAIAGVAIVAVAGGLIFMSTRFSKRTRLARRLAAVDVALKATIANGPALELTRDELQQLHASIGDFLRLTTSRGYRTVRLAIDEGQRQNLRAFAEALRSFTSNLVSDTLPQEPIPELPPDRVDKRNHIH